MPLSDHRNSKDMADYLLGVRGSIRNLVLTSRMVLKLCQNLRLNPDERRTMQGKNSEKQYVLSSGHDEADPPGLLTS